jgi:hypothetical protein
MTLARFLAAALLFWSVSCFAQDRQPIGDLPAFHQVQSVPVFGSAAAAPSAPWRLAPNDPQHVGASTPLEHTQQFPKQEFKSELARHVSTAPLGAEAQLMASPRQFVIGPDGVLSDSICYTIRSYVVARDAKGSDATHLVRSSTCQPASRFHVRTAQGESASHER